MLKIILGTFEKAKQITIVGLLEGSGPPLTCEFLGVIGAPGPKLLGINASYKVTTGFDLNAKNKLSDSEQSWSE